MLLYADSILRWYLPFINSIFSHIFYNLFFLGYVRSILGNSRSITKNEAQLLASALRANYGKMFCGMTRKFH
jgi:hypothetical protein